MSRHLLRIILHWRRLTLKSALLAIVLSCVSVPGCNVPTEKSPEQHISVCKEAGIFWLKTPDNRRFFSLGVNSANRGEVNDPARTAGYDADAYNPDRVAWATATARRLEAWGFSTIAGWGDWKLLGQVPVQFFHSPVLHIGSKAGAPWRDLWDPKWAAVMNQQAHSRIQPSDARVLGHYSDNELDWWNGELFRETLNHKTMSGQRQRLVALLQKTYENDWGHLTLDFEPEGANSFEELGQSGQVYLRPGGSGIKVYRQFLAMIASRYYQLTSSAFRGQSPRSLLLGDRYFSAYYPELIHAAARELDVISTNLKASWNDGTFARFYLDTIHKLSGKPVIVSEIYFASMENTTGNQNRVGSFPVVATQEERAMAVQQSMIELTRLPVLTS
jgi:hypothetical protein